MMRKFLFLATLLLLLAGAAYSQRKEISGKVMDASTGEPISGVNIIAANNRATVSKADGSYTLAVDPGTKLLIFSHVSFASQTIEINDQSVIDVRLVPAAGSMEDVVVIGYGTQKKIPPHRGGFQTKK